MRMHLGHSPDADGMHVSDLLFQFLFWERHLQGLHLFRKIDDWNLLNPDDGDPKGRR